MGKKEKRYEKTDEKKFIHSFFKNKNKKRMMGEKKCCFKKKRKKKGYEKWGEKKNLSCYQRGN